MVLDDIQTAQCRTCPTYWASVDGLQLVRMATAHTINNTGHLVELT